MATMFSQYQQVSTAPEITSSQFDAMNKALSETTSLDAQKGVQEAQQASLRDTLNKEKAETVYPFERGTEVDMGELEKWVVDNPNFEDREYYYHAVDVLNQDAADADRENGFLKRGDSPLEYGRLMASVDASEGRLADAEFQMSKATNEEEYQLAVEQRELAYKETTKAKVALYDYGYQSEGGMLDTIGAAVGGIVEGTLNPIDSIKGVIRQEVKRNAIDTRDPEVAEAIQNWGGGMGVLTAGIDAISSVLASTTGGTSKVATDAIKKTFMSKLIGGITKGVIKGAAVGSAGGAVTETGILGAGASVGVDYEGTEALERVATAGALGSVVGGTLGAGTQATKVVGGKGLELGGKYASEVATASAFASGGGILAPIAGSITNVIKDTVRGTGRVGSIADNILAREDISPEGKQTISGLKEYYKGDMTKVDNDILRGMVAVGSDTLPTDIANSPAMLLMRQLRDENPEVIKRWEEFASLPEDQQRVYAESTLKDDIRSITSSSIKRSAVEGLVGGVNPVSQWVKSIVSRETAGSKTTAAITSSLVGRKALTLDNPQLAITDATNVFTRRFLSNDLSKVVRGIKDTDVTPEGLGMDMIAGNYFLVQNSATLNEFEAQIEESVVKYDAQERMIRDVLTYANNPSASVMDFSSYESGDTAQAFKVALMGDVANTLKTSSEGNTITRELLTDLYASVTASLESINDRVRAGKTIKEPTPLQRELHKDNPIPEVTAYDFAMDMGLIQ